MIVSYVPVADAIDQLLFALDDLALNKRSGRTAQTLLFQSTSLRAVGQIDAASYTRSDWSLGQQASIAVPLLAKTLHKRTSVDADLITNCNDACSMLATQLQVVIEGYEPN